LTSKPHRAGLARAEPRRGKAQSFKVARTCRGCDNRVSDKARQSPLDMQVLYTCKRKGCRQRGKDAPIINEQYN